MRKSAVEDLEKPEKVEYAAIRLEDGRLYSSKLGHFDCLMQALDENPDLKDEFQDGFVTTAGRFVTREEAYKLAVASGQVDKSSPTFRSQKPGSSSELSSEDVPFAEPEYQTAALQRLFRGPVLVERKILVSAAKVRAAISKQ